MRRRIPPRISVASRTSWYFAPAPTARCLRRAHTSVQLATAEEVLALEPDLSLIPTAMVGAIGAHPEGSGHHFEMRTFAPGPAFPRTPPAAA
ncbi:hypothetical protein [Streptomyces sp. CA-111067]|uniref:hypothetical protein n=1 Tax=Streptomyces sp. CA-111067 TaxID=3240046 RepID=UPI003D9647D8